MKFIDLFAGLGGFHLALQELGHECVYASEIDDTLRDVYKMNFGIYPEGDIRKIDIDKIPHHDILCAGFPCQPFSKAGSQEGLKDKERGDLFYYILKVIDKHKPEYLLLENVPNIRKHDDGQTWQKMEWSLRDRGYDISYMELSPHHLGIPQIRLRMYIVGKRGLQSLKSYAWPTPQQNKKISISSILEDNPIEAQKISPIMENCLDIWQEFLNILPIDKKIPHPIWAMEFGATYPYEGTTPYALSYEELLKYKGSFGKTLKGDSKSQLMGQLPSHAIREEMEFPEWKIKMIKRNREFYKENKKWLDEWKKKISTFATSYQKLEWNCQGESRNLNNYIIQFRASGVRVKRLTTAPSLVAMTSTQVPVIGWERRYMTIDECKRLQSMDALPYLPGTKSKAYEALGNTININVAKLVARSLLIQKNEQEVIQ